MVPFQGDGPSWQAAMGGKIDASFNNLGITFPQIKAGNLRPLALFAAKRDSNLPDVPTLREIGYDVISGSSRGYSAPKGIPADAREALIQAFRKMGENPEFQKTAGERALPLDLKYGDEYTEYLQNQEKAFRDIWNEVKSQYQK